MQVLDDAMPWRLTPAMPEQQLGASFSQRFPNVPPGYLQFLQSFSRLQTEDGTLWFNSMQDFNSEVAESAGSMFAWNEFELQSLQAFYDDEAGQQQVRSFWDAHLPILLSVQGHYSYVALGVATHNWGQVFAGEEPEYEEAQCIAPSFQQWLDSCFNQL
jgi:hypothetical protein